MFHVFRAGLVNDFGAFARDVSRKGGLALEHAVQNFFHPERETIGLGEARDFWFAVTRSQNRGELAKTVNALIIHLDRDDALELLEDFFEAVRQRMQMAQMQSAAFFTLPSCAASYSRSYPRIATADIASTYHTL